MGSLTNYEIEDVAKHYRIPLIDCCMKDELPDPLKNGYYIVNLQSSTQGDGTHWTVLIVQPKIAVFMDSFGAPPSTEIVDFVKKRKGIHLAFNNEIIQDLSSENCGYFCLYLCWFVEKYKRTKPLIQLVDDFTRLFREDTKLNDAVLQRLFKEIPDKSLPKPVLKLLRKKH